MRYWQKYLHIVLPGRLSRILAAVRDHAGPVDDLADYAFNITKSARAYVIQGQWGSRPPLLSLDESDRERGQRSLREMGLPDGAWFVCLHAREGGYSPGDEHRHSYRNVDIASFDQAVTSIGYRFNSDNDAPPPSRKSRGATCARLIFSKTASAFDRSPASNVALAFTISSARGSIFAASLDMLLEAV